MYSSKDTYTTEKKSKGALLKLDLIDVNEQEMNSTTHKEWSE